MDWVTKKLESRGAKEMTIKDRNAVLWVGCGIELILITILMIFIGIVWLKLTISLYLLITLLTTIVIIEKDIDAPDFMFLIIVPIHLIFFLSSIALVIAATPYRGKNEMKIRKHKLKRLIRKSKFDKLKFWK